jgi:hypothetical protein
MVNGLCIDEKEFMSMPPKRQMCVLFQNTEELKFLIKGYKFWQKISTVIGSVLVIGMTYLFKLHLGG